MALNIKDPETDRLVRELAAATTHPLTDEQVTASVDAGVAAFLRAYAA